MNRTPPANGACLLGVGAYRPVRIVPNDEICAAIDSSDEWIQRRSGIVSRRYAGPDETVVTMAVEAGSKALAHAGVRPDEVDAVLLASMSYLHQSPAAAPQVAHQLGAVTAAAFDVSAACAGFCYGLALADAMIRAGTSRYVVLIGSERMTDIVDPYDRGTAFLFADGAGAVVVGPADEPMIGPVVWGADGSRYPLIMHSGSWLETRESPDRWPTMRMMGQEVFRWAVQEVLPVAQKALALAGVTVDELAAFIPHQANLRIVDKMAYGLRLPPSVVVARDVVTAGNTSAASIPLALDSLLASGQVAPRGTALLAGFGAGLTHAALTVTLPSP